MLFILLYLVIIFVVLLFMNTRVKIIWNHQNFELFIYNLRILKLNLNDTKKYALNNIKTYKFNKNDLKYLEILKSIDFRLINIRICGLQGDYFSWSIAYGIFEGIFSLAKNYFEEKGISYQYHVDFYGEPFISLKSIFYFKLGKI